MELIPYIGDLEKWKRDFSFFITIKVRFSETDMFGHVNNVSSFIYFEEARIEYLKSVGLSFSNTTNESNVPIVADLQCNYHKQMFFGEKLKMYVKVNHVGNTSLDIHYMALNDKNEICLTGRGRMVYINSITGKPISLTDSMKKKLQA